MNTWQYVVSEVERQKSTNYDEFADALEFAKVFHSWNSQASPKGFIMLLAEKVEPEVNRFERMSNLRLSEVGFINGGKATKAADVQHQFSRWCGILEFEANDFGGSIQDYIDGDESLCDSYIKQLLQIHPWADGNGRTASILRNWMLDTLDDPTPLPDYSF